MSDSIYARAMRETFKPKPGDVLADVAFSSIEARSVGVRQPTATEIARAQAEILAEDAAARARYMDDTRGTSLPSEHPDHVHNLKCDGQDGRSSQCVRLRVKLFGADRKRERA